MIGRYPPRLLLGDYIRAGGGLLVCLVVLLQLQSGDLMFYVAAALGLLFLLFGVQTWRRSRHRVEFTDDYVAILPSGRTVMWSKLTGCKLSYYSTRRDNRNGWMQLQLSSGDNVIKIDSRLDLFQELAGHAERVARGLELEMTASTVSNFEALHKPQQ